MNYSSYTYETPEYAKESMSQPEAYSEFTDEAARLITQYVRKYAPNILPNSLSELHIRDILCYESRLKRKLDLPIRDYWIKVYLFIRKRDKSYEREVLKLYDYVVH